MKLRFLSVFLCLCLLIGLLPMSAAADETLAEDISSVKLVTVNDGFPSKNALFDGKLLSGSATSGNASLTLEYADGIGSLYFLFDIPYGMYSITNNDTGKALAAGRDGFLHEFVDLTAAFGSAPTSVTIDFSNGSVKLYELFVYTEGEVPSSVQKWNAPADGQTDLVLFSTHGDDEQLFFAGVLPYYACELGYQVQVVYFTDHRKDDPHRIHEMLNGLWAVGVTAYPVFGSHPDFLRKHDLAGTYAGFKSRGYTREEMLGFVVENLRRFKPLVAVGHDINGEYGHGMHMVYTDLLMEAITITNDATYYPESAEKYGLWDTPKTYLHLYEENEIVMDWDQPLDSFNGMTAFEVTQQLGYPCHASQYQDFAWYHVYVKTAKDVRKYNPCYYGLYRSTVGEDVQKNDFFENLTTYAEQARIAEEQRLEAERLAAEEEARRLEEERIAEEKRLAEEEARRQAELAAAEAARLAEEQRLAEEAAQKRASLFMLLGICGFLLFLLIILLVIRAKTSRKSSR